MGGLVRWRFELFVSLLAALELASVASTRTAHRPAALVATGTSVLVLLGRRWQPLAATVGAFAALTVCLAVVPRSTTAQFFGTLATFAVAGAVNREQEAAVAWLAGAGLLAYAAWVDPYGGGTADFALSLAFGTTMWGAGLLVARRGRHVQAALARAEHAERDQAEADRQARAEERARIARELHDVVSHGLSVVVLQALAARTALEDSTHGSAEALRHLDAVESTARDALAEMRRMLGVLEADQLLLEADPAPRLAQLDELVARLQPGLGAVRLRVGLGLGLPQGLEVTAYRIVQEALTNAAKHAPGAEVSVVVERVGGAVEVRVQNGSGAATTRSPQGAGRGLVGVRERVALYDGHVEAGPDGRGGYALVARVPLPDAPSERALRRVEAS
jgi:signal transduction histidine kinase